MKIGGCEFPDSLLYDVENGTWAEPAEGRVRVGITGLLSWASGVFTSVTFKPVGTAVARGGVLGSVEGSLHFDVVRSPSSGVISATNLELLSSPKLLNSRPYDSGWFAEVRPGAAEDLGRLRGLPAARPLIAEELDRRRVHCFAKFPDVEMAEIGVECAAVLVRLDELLAGSAVGTVVHVISDDSSAEIEMHRWSDLTGNALLESRKEQGVYHFIVEKK